MRKALTTVAILLLGAARLLAQCTQCQPNPTQLLLYPGVPSGTCSLILPLMAEDQATGVIYGCAIIGGVATWVAQTGGGVASPVVAPNLNVIYASPNCGTQTNCFPVKFDVQRVTDASSTASSTTITTPSADPPFVAGDVGKEILGTGHCTGPISATNCALDLPLGTISAFVSAHQVTVSVAATGTDTASLNLAWGHPDSVNINAALASAPAGVTSTLVLPSGLAFVNKGFLAPSVVIVGQGAQTTELIPTPDFDFTTGAGNSCGGLAGSASRIVCFFQADSYHWGILGLGQPIAGSPTVDLWEGGGGGDNDFSIVGWGADSPNVIGAIIEPGNGGVEINLSSIFAGSTACATPPETGPFEADSTLCQSDTGTAIKTTAGAVLTAHNTAATSTSGNSVDATAGSFVDDGGNTFTGAQVGNISHITTVATAPVVNDCAKWASATVLADAGAACGIGSSGLSGMTAGQIPVAATANTITSSIAKQGTDSSLLSSGTISGTSAALCTDVNGGATTVSCPSGGGFSGQTVNGIPIAATATTSTSSTTVPATAGQYTVKYMPPTNVAVPPSVTQDGSVPRDLTGACSTDTIAFGDNLSPVYYKCSAAVAVALPTPTTLGNTGFTTQLINNTSGAATAVTVTATTLTFDRTGTTTLTIAQGQQCVITADANGTVWDTKCSDAPYVAGANITITRGQFGPTIAATGGLSGLTTNTIPIATSATAIGDGPLAYDGTGTITATPTSGATFTITVPATKGLNLFAVNDLILKSTTSTDHVRFQSGEVLQLAVVAFSATPAFNAGADNGFEITLTANVTSSSVTNPLTGESISFIVCQDATGGRTFAWPANFRGAGVVGSTLSTCSSESFLYDGTSWFSKGAIQTGE